MQEKHPGFHPLDDDEKQLGQLGDFTLPKSNQDLFDDPEIRKKMLYALKTSTFNPYSMQFAECGLYNNKDIDYAIIPVKDGDVMRVTEGRKGKYKPRHGLIKFDKQYFMDTGGLMDIQTARGARGGVKGFAIPKYSHIICLDEDKNYMGLHRRQDYCLHHLAVEDKPFSLSLVD